MISIRSAKQMALKKKKNHFPLIAIYNYVHMFKLSISIYQIIKIHSKELSNSVTNKISTVLPNARQHSFLMAMLHRAFGNSDFSWIPGTWEHIIISTCKHILTQEKCLRVWKFLKKKKFFITENYKNPWNIEKSKLLKINSRVFVCMFICLY